jgi:hypothetical protein
VSEFDKLSAHGDWFESESDVSVLTEAFQMSVVRVPKFESVLVEYAQTFAGMAEILVASDVDAVCTTVLVFAFTTAATEVVAL